MRVTGGRRRRPQPEGGRREHAVLVKLSAEERHVLNVQAAAAGYDSIPHFLLDAADAAHTGVALRDRQELLTALTGALRDLARVGGNLNQIAHHANVGGRVELDAQRTFSEVRQTVRQMSATFDGIASRLRPYGGRR